jgi:phosphomannomutase
MIEAEGEYDRVIGYEANGGVLVGSTIEKNGQVLQALPTRDAAIVPLTILLLAKEQGLTVSGLLKTLPERYTVSHRLKDFSTELSQSIISQFVDLPLAVVLQRAKNC